VRHEVGRFFAEKLGALEAVNLDGGPEATLALRGEALEDTIGSAGTGLALVLVLLQGVPAAPKAAR
jgi:exopolysaccharide biosynthesis protein